ncbi:SPOR domain-containing protein [Marinoscillum furvescens]|uniref:Sporulation related protein n=1 Tax=Marinoscillum furvescens DSM 4134 TaxID=1122208 RepID=A0A3D9L0J7_MARFU|nr:SPOR domain-containing protein [Marinoscillum furvescens]RED94916.1 sporulation related protein [Marinoscillum furvescens DSM 4134]
MADEKNKNEDPEEKKDDQFDDDEDFGLPDLEYEELDEDDEEDIEEDSPEPPKEEEPQAESPEAPIGEEVLDDDIDISADDFDSSDEPEDWEKELEKELEEELKAEGDTGGFYEEESYEEFEDSGEDLSSGSVFDSDSSDEKVEGADSYSDQPAAAAGGAGAAGGGTYASAYADSKSESKGKFVRTVVIGTLLFAVIAVVFYLMYDGGDEAPKKVADKVEQKKAPAKKPAAKQPVKKQTPPPKKEETKKPAPKTEQNRPAQANAVPAGEITRLPDPTGKAYIVIGSFFDDDLAMDYARELSAEGKSPFVIPPFKDHRFHRVAIAEYNSFSDASASVEGFKTEYGPDIWPLKY